MFEKTTLNFLSSLAKNNNKPWFDTNRNLYDNAKTNLLENANLLIEAISKHDAAIAESKLEAKQCISRINRDIRFSTNKQPYKNNFFIWLKAGGKKTESAGYFLQIEPGKSFIGGGIYMPMAPELNKIRQEIDYNYTEWQKIISNKTFLNTYTKGIQTPASLSRPPKGYTPENPAVEYLKMKGFFVICNISDAELLDKNFIKDASKKQLLAKPLIEFINRSL